MRYEAIYARQSVDKVDSISIESQIEICEREVGKNYKVYSDKGYSGKNTDRPELARLLQDIRADKIDRVVVYRLDRISRSVLDFSKMIGVFQEHNVEFVSTMEKFDTSSPIGNAMLMIVMVFAQLERETIQQRILDAYRSRSEKGFYMGGRIPYGFTLGETTLDGVRTKMFVPVEEEIKHVREMFKIYSHPRASLGDVVRHLAERDIKTKDGNDFARATVRDILISPVYAKFDLTLYNFFLKNKVRIITPQSDFIGVYGGYLYSDVNKRKGKSTNLEGLMLVLAPHEGVIESDEWLKCRKKCLSNMAVAKPRKARVTWLAGKLKCAECGYALTSTYSGPKGSKYRRRYYVCNHKYDSHACSFRSIRADDLDALVFDAMKKKIAVFKEFSVSDQSERRSKIEKIRTQITEIDLEIGDLLEKIADATPTVMQYINKKVESFDSEKSKLEAQMMELIESETVTNTVDLEKAMEMWEDFSIEDKMAIVDYLIESIQAWPDNVTIKWKI